MFLVPEKNNTLYTITQVMQPVLASLVHNRFGIQMDVKEIIRWSVCKYLAP